MSDNIVLVERDGPVAVLTNNDAPYNRMSLDFMDQLEATVAESAADDGVRAVVITAAGWLLWVYALDNLQAGLASLATLAAPPIAMVSSAIHSGERPTMLEFAGMLLIGVALLVLSLHSMRAVPLTTAQ